MNYTVNLHSGIINPSRPKISENKESEVVVIEYRLLEEILKQAADADVADQLLEKIKGLKDTGVLTVKAHSDAFDLKAEDNKKLEDIKKLAGI